MQKKAVAYITGKIADNFFILPEGGGRIAFPMVLTSVANQVHFDMDRIPFRGITDPDPN